MNRNILFRAMLCAAAFFCLSGAAVGQEENPRRVNAKEAVNLTSKSNPGLKAAMLEKEQARVSVEAQGDIYPFVLRLDGGLNHNSSPAINGEDVIANKSDIASIGAELRKTFPIGTSASFRLEGDRSVADSALDQINSDPVYGLGAELSITQPILRGAGKRVGESGLRQARIQEKTAQSREERIASETVRNVLSTYWTLWYADRAVGIETAARDLAKSQLDEMTARVEHGEVAPVDVLAYQTRVESLEESVVTAQAERRTMGIELKRMVGAEDASAFWFPDDKEVPPVPELTGDVEAVIQKAVERSPELVELKNQVELARETEKIAGEDLRPALDVTGTLSARVLGSQQVDPSFDQLRGDAYSAYLGLIYEMPLSDTRKKSERARAAMDVSIAGENLTAARSRVEAEVRTAVDKLESSKRILELVAKTADVAEKQAEAARERFDLGAAVYLEVKEAEETSRQAKLRLERARIDAAQAGITLAHLTGELLEQIDLR